MNHQALDVLGGITAQQFLDEYWQKKPLLVRNAMPEIQNLLEPDDLLQLALEEHVTSRLIQQQGPQHDQWHVKCSPLSSNDFKQLPPYWTLLIQALDHHSLDIHQLWEKFFFLPLWRRDDVMISYAPKGGSVGRHFDFYDVFLVQAHGQRRWQLGQMCNADTPFIKNQPLKLLSHMDVWFDEILDVGDLLYVPPCLSHYGVAENDCLTLSFGFRMPHIANIMDRTSDQLTHCNHPLPDIKRHAIQPIGEISTQELNQLKTQLIHHLHHCDELNQAIMSLISEVKYPDTLPEADPLDLDDLNSYYQNHNCLISLEPSNRLIYRQLDSGLLEFWANGELLNLHPHSLNTFKLLADGQCLNLSSSSHFDHAILNDILMAINQSILMIHDS